MRAFEQEHAEIRVPAYRADHSLCAEAFVAGTADGWIASPLSEGGKQSRFKGHIWSVGDYMFTDLYLGAFAFKVEQRHFQNQGPHALFERNISGTTYGVSGGEDYRLSPDCIRMNGQRQARELVINQIRVQEVMILKTELGFEIGEALEGKKIWPRNMNNRLLFTEWNGIYQGLLRGDNYVPKSALDRLTSLMKIALGADPRREDVRVQARHALYRQTCRFIEQNLSSPDLSVDLLLQNFGLSRASLFRMFEDSGGVRAYLMEIRTVRAVLDIWQADSARGSIQAASDRYGFSSSPNFNRAVKRLLGDRPGAFFELPKDLSKSAPVLNELMRKQLERRWASSVRKMAPQAA